MIPPRTNRYLPLSAWQDRLRTFIDLSIEPRQPTVELFWDRFTLRYRTAALNRYLQADWAAFVIVLFAKYLLAMALFRDFYAPVFDNLDSVVPYNVVSGRFWASGFDPSTYDVFIGGYSRWYHYFQALSPQTLFYAFLTPRSAYLSNEVLGLALSFWGGKKLFSEFGLKPWLARFFAVIFAISVSYSTYGLGFLAAPAVFWIALRPAKPTVWALLGVFVIGLSSSLAEHGFFLPIGLLATMWAFDRWEHTKRAFGVSLTFLVGSVLSSAGIIYASLAGPDFHRVEMLGSQEVLSLGAVLAKTLAHMLILDGAAQASIVPAVFAGPALLIGVISSNPALRKLSLRIGAVVFLAGLVGALQDPIDALMPGPLKSIQLSRIKLYSSIPLLILAGLLWQNLQPTWSRVILRTSVITFAFISFLATNGINPDNLKASVPEKRMGALLAELRSTGPSALFTKKFFATYGINLASFRRAGETFTSHFRDPQYQCLKAALPKSRVISVGLDPMIAPYQGIAAIDGYHNLYPLEYKYKFAEVIKDQLPVSRRGPAYFYNWGSRLNSFVLSGDTFLLNLDAARDLGATQVISAFVIPSLGKPQIVCTADNFAPIYAYAL